jgi:hypothetical protein
MYGIALCIHVLAAVFGAGQVAAIFTVAATARRGLSPEAASSIVKRLLSRTARGLVPLLVSGVILDFAAGRAFDHAGWFRLSVLLLLVLASLVGVATRTLERAGGGGESVALARVGRLAVVMSLVIGVAVVLMELKPW